jgi:hypothetical protein
MIRPPSRLGLLAVVSCTLYARGAAAQVSSSDAAAAQDLFDRARGFVAQGDFKSACPKFEESQRLDPEPGTEFNLADCYEHVGRTASAWVAFVDVADTLHTKGDAPREKVARERAASLQPKLMRLQINVAPEARVPGLVIKRDAETVRDAQFGIGVPVDPGPHTISAQAPGAQAWTRQVSTSGPGETASISVPALTPEATATSPAPPVAPPPVATTATPPAPPPPPPPAPSKPGSAQRTAAYVVGGVGLAAMLVGGFFGIQSISMHGTYTGECPNNVCASPQGVSDHDSAVSDGNLSTILVGAGAAVLAAGVVLYLTAPKASSAKALGEVRAAPLVGAGTAGVAVGGSF